MATGTSRAKRWFWDWRLYASISLGLAVFTGIVKPLGLAGLATTALLAFLTLRTQGLWKGATSAATVALCVALGAHLLPGIKNPILFSGAISPAATEYRLFWNFDKAFAGLILLQLVPWQAPLPFQGARAWKACLGFLAAAILVAVLTAMTRWDPKITGTLLLWAPANLFLVCIPEEALFRLLIQGKWEAWRLARGNSASICVYGAAVLFGLIHFRGGPIYMAVATLAGAAYGFAYQAKRNPWHPILVHFCLNLLHFVCFAYPFSRS